jgi:hypothetical protein
MSADRSLLMLRNSNLSKGAGLVHYITQPSIMCACRRNLWVLFCSTIGLWLESKLKFWTCWGEGRIVIHWRKITRKTRKRVRWQCRPTCRCSCTLAIYQKVLASVIISHSQVSCVPVVETCEFALFLSRFADVAPNNSLHSLLPLLSCNSHRTKWSGCRRYIVINYSIR